MLNALSWSRGSVSALQRALWFVIIFLDAVELDFLSQPSFSFSDFFSCIIFSLCEYWEWKKLLPPYFTAAKRS